MNKVINTVKEHKFILLFLLAAFALMLGYELANPIKFIQKVDPYEYYSYLPAYFIEHDFTYTNKYPIGTAILEFPFFLIAHGLTLLVDASAADGYSLLYQKAVGICALSYYVIGTVNIYGFLCRKFEKVSATWTCILLTVGTFLPLYCTRYGGFSHIFTYALAAIFMNMVDRIDERDDFFYHFRIGVIAGLFILLRNINVFLLLFYLLYNMGNKGEYIGHIKKVFSLKRLLPNILGGGIVVFFQLLHWKMTSEHWVMYSYEDEGFWYLNNPKVYEILLGNAKGLLIYCPVLILSFFGIYFLWKSEQKSMTLAVASIMLVEIVISSTWWCWWFGGVYGMRPFIDIFPFMAIPMAACLQWIVNQAKEKEGRKKNLFLASYIVLIGILCFFNVVYLNGEYTKIVSQWLANAYEQRAAWKAIFLFWK